MTGFLGDVGTRSQPRPLAGFGELLRFAMRLDRLRAPLWVGSIVGLVAVSVASVVGLYDTQSELQQYADLARADAALKAIAGPGHGLDEPTLGAVVMNEILVYSFVGVALMCTFLLIRHTRAEEQTDRAELVRAAPVGRVATLAAACAWVAMVDVVVAVGVTASLLAFGLPAAGSLAYGAATCGVGLVFIGVAATTAQVAASARAASAAAGTTLGVCFLLRAVGDLGTGWITWLSPLGWAQSVRAFADERWWVLAPLGLGACGLTLGAVALSTRRDLGAGSFAQRPGPAWAGPHLSSPLAMAARLTRTSLVSWTVGLAILGFFFGIVADQAEQMLESEAIADFFAQIGVGTPSELFLATTVLMVALTASGYTVSTVLRLRTEELELRAEPVLATPVSRRTWVMSYLTVSIAGTIVVMVVSGLAIGLGSTAQLGEGGQLLPVIGASLAMVPALSVLAGLAVVLVGWRPRWSPLAWAGVAVGAVVGLLAETLGLPSWLRDVSPFHHVPPLPAAELEWLPLVILMLVAIGSSAVGIAAMGRRDVGAGR